MCIINRTDKLIRIQHEKKHGKGSKNSSAYFDNKMIEEEEMEKQIDQGSPRVRVFCVRGASYCERCLLALIS